VLGGPYPSACLYMESVWIAGHRSVVQKLANAFARTLRYMASHDAGEIADLVPAEFYAGDRALYVAALRQSLSMFTADGRMPQGGPENVRRVLATIMPSVGASEIDLSRTYTNAFIDAVQP
jgi:NitT/TauT family transport system substrate-binding protein